jgi:D-alanine-D-alanine ligase
MSKIRVAVIRGGPSTEYEVSLKTGESILKNLPKKYEAVDVFIDKEGIWHIKGKPIKPQELSHKCEVVFNALHGQFGEDGTVQKILEDLHIPFTGSKSLASAIGMNKALSKDFFKKHGLKVAHGKVIKKSEYNKHTASELFKSFPQPSVFKPVRGGSSVGTSIAHTIEEIHKALDKAFLYDDQVLIEECIKGKEATCGVIENFRNEHLYALLPVEIVPNKGKFFDYDTKYGTETGEVEKCPGNFTLEESKKIQELAKEAHKAIGARHYSRSDFILHPKRGIFILEINTLPGLTTESLVPKEIKAIGSSYGEFLGHLIELALKR